MDLFGWGVFPPPWFNDDTSSNHEILKYSEDDDELCDIELEGFLMGFDRAQCNKTMMDWASYSTSSVRTIVQYAQEINSGILTYTLSTLFL